MISILLPTRKRPSNLRRLIDSLRETSLNMPQILCYIDQDDDSYNYKYFQEVVFIRGPRMEFGSMWTELAKYASGEILSVMGDDVVFQTRGWDKIVEDAFAECADKILMVHGDDKGNHVDDLATLPIVHRRWVDITGYLTPPGFSFEWVDTWINDVAKMIGRRKKLPYVTEHLHWVWGKAPMDETYEDGMNREKQDQNNLRYAQRHAEREADAAKLRKAISV